MIHQVPAQDPRVGLLWTACLTIGIFTLALEGCTGVSDQARQQAQAMVNLGRVQYADEHNPRGAIESWQRALQLDADNAQAHLFLGQVFGATGMFDRAEPELRRAVALFIERVREDESERVSLAEARNTLAAALVNTGHYDEAIALSRQVTEEVLYPTPYLAWGNLGLAYYRKGEYQQAATALERSVAIQPRYCAGRFHLGSTYFHLNDMGHALDALNRVIDSQDTECSTIQEAFLVRARVHTALHQDDATRADLARCTELAADSDVGRECASLARPAAPKSNSTRTYHHTHPCALRH